MSEETSSDQKVFVSGFAKPMTQGEFTRFSDLIGNHCGIKMPPSKKVMLEARLQKRLRVLGLPTFSEYFDYVKGDGGASEFVHFLDAVTTNKTDFFRESVHFEFLNRTVLPEALNEQEQSVPGVRTFNIWSAGCSTGEEPYTMAMVLCDFTERHPSFRFSILATDISSRVLDRAREAVYDGDHVASVSQAMKQKYLLRSKDRSKNQVRIAPAVRSAVRFQRLNLMEEAFKFAEPLDAIFCRNVMIYFDRDTQQQLLEKFCRVLRPNGYMFLGHSESIHGFTLPLRRLVSTVYRKNE
jgi:chemotaxis protein methyltransferase CheR